jgi:hypothetical protein
MAGLLRAFLLGDTYSLPNEPRPYPLFTLVSIFAPLVAHSPAKGAETSIFLASSPSVEGMTGKYFYDSRVIAAAPQSTDMVVARKLWDASTGMVDRADSSLAKK